MTQIVRYKKKAEERLGLLEYMSKTNQAEMIKEAILSGRGAITFTNRNEE